jgi:hypothetical protein
MDSTSFFLNTPSAGPKDLELLNGSSTEHNKKEFLKIILEGQDNFNQHLLKF